LNSNRGSNRRRGRGNNRPQSGRGQEQANRIDSRARGNANQLLEKYKKLAHDAQVNGDRVNTEYYLQFADHYFRVLADNRARQEEARQKRDDDRSDRYDQRGSGDGDDTYSYDDSDQDDSPPRHTRSQKVRNDDDEGQSQGQGQGQTPDEPASGDTSEKPARTRGRPRAKPKAKKDEAAADDSNGFDASVLPPSISNDEEAKAKPAPRKRAPRKRAAATEEQDLPQAANG
jgi:hypothetical protein